MNDVAESGLCRQRGSPAAATAALKRTLVVLLVAAAALWPAVVNGGPFWMADTPSYFRAADSAGAEMFGIETAWTADYDRLYRSRAATPTQPAAATPAAPTSPNAEVPVTLKGRSIYYGALLYGAYLLGTLWLVVMLQSTIAAICITITLTALFRAAGRPARDRTLTLVGVGLAALTPLGFFASYLMPDVFGAFALLALVSLLFLRGHLSRGAQGFLLAVLAYSLLAHSTNLLLALLLLVLTAIVHAVTRTGPDRKAYAGVAACLAVGFGGQAAFDLTVERITGAPPVRPPFIAMRLIADGPGLAYLRSNCAEEPFLYCRVKDASRPHSDTLLWSLDPSKTLFRGLPPREQRLAAAQELPFVLAVVKDRPLAVLRAMSIDAFQQLVRLDLKEFNYVDINRQRFASVVPQQLQQRIGATRAYSEVMPVRAHEALAMLSAAASLIVLLLFLWRTRRAPLLTGPSGAALFVIVAVALNAAICGALSGPNGRYQMRLIWVLPLVAAGVVAAKPRSHAASFP